MPEPRQPESVLRDRIREDQRFKDATREIATHFYDKEYKNERLPEIREWIERQIHQVAPKWSESDITSLAGSLIGDLVQKAERKADPPGPDPLPVEKGPLPEEDYDKLPGPLYSLLEQVDGETEPFRRVHRLIDAIEWAIKWYTVLALSDLMDEKELGEDTKVLLAHGLRTPSLGLWNKFFRRALEQLENPTAPWDRWERLTQLEDKHHLVAFRNRYGHGATPPDRQCEKDVEEYLPRVRRLIHSPVFTEVGLAVKTQKSAPILLDGGERISLPNVELPDGHTGALLPDLEAEKPCSNSWEERSILDLWPLGMASPNNPRFGSIHEVAEAEVSGKETVFFYFNALKNEAVERLNYEIPLRDREKSLFEPFHEKFPLQEWKKIRSPNRHLSRARAEALTEDFVGRRRERRKILDFAANGEGTLVIFGAPGIGKSSLLAQVLREIKAGVDLDGDELMGTDDQSIDPPPVIEYFPQRGYGDNPVHFLRHLCKRLDDQYDLSGQEIGNEEVELREQLDSRLQAIEESAADDEASPKRSVLLVDGLDESPSLGKYIPAARPWLPVIVSSRETTESKSFYERRARETRQKFVLSPLSTQDVRAMMYKVVDKYNPNLTDEYVDEIVSQSGGNPLYLKLLCEDLFHGDLEVGDSAGLPEKIGELYRSAVQRVTSGGEDEVARKVILVLAVAKTPLTEGAIMDLINENMMRVQAARRSLMELLRREQATDANTDKSNGSTSAFQLFHETLREWLWREYPIDCEEMSEQVATRCFEWRERRERGALRYALQHAAVHLKEIGDSRRLWELLTDEEYRSAQIDKTEQYSATSRSLEHGIETYAERDGATPKDDARLCYLTLLAGSLSRRAEEEVQKVFRWAENGKVEKALARVAVLSEEEQVLVSLQLLCIEAKRQREKPEEARSQKAAQMTMEFLENQVVPDVKIHGVVGLNTTLSLTIHLFNIFSGIGVQELFYEKDTFGRYVDKMLDKAKNIKKEARKEFISNCLNIARNVEDKERKSKCISKVALKYAENDNGEFADAVFEEALRIAHSVNFDRRRAMSLSYLAVQLSHTRDSREALRYDGTVFSQALSAARTIDVDGNRAETLIRISLHLAEAGRLEESKATFNEAVDTIQSIDSKSDQCSVYSDIASTLAKKNRLDLAELMLSEALDAAKSIPRGFPHGLWRDQAMRDVESAASDLEDAVTDPARTEEELKSLKQVSAKLEDKIGIRSIPSKAYLERSKAYAEIVSALIEEGEPGDSETAFEYAVGAARSCEPEVQRVEALGYIGCNLSGTRREQWKTSVFEEALENARSAEQESRPELYVQIGLFLTKARSFDRAAEVFNKAMDEAHSLDHPHSAFVPIRVQEKVEEIISDLIKNGHKEDASNIASMMKYQSTQKVLNEVVYAWAEEGQFDKAIDAAENIKKDEVRNNSLLKVVSFCVENKKFKKAKKALSCVKSKLEKTKGIVCIASCNGGVKETNKPERLLLRALKVAMSTESNIEKSKSVLSVAKGYAKCGNLEKARSLSNRAINLSNKIDAEYKSQCLPYITDALADMGMQEKAYKAHKAFLREVSNIKEIKIRQFTLQEYASSLAENKQFDLVESILDKVNSLSENDIVSSIMGQKVIEKTAKNMAKSEMYERSFAYVENLEDKFKKNKIYSKLVPIISNSGNVEKVIEVSQRMTSSSAKKEAVADVAKDIVLSGRPKSIEAILENIELTTENRKEVIKAWKEAVIEYSDNPATLLKESIISEYNKKIDAIIAVYYLIQANCRIRNWNHVKKIVEYANTKEWNNKSFEDMNKTI